MSFGFEGCGVFVCRMESFLVCVYEQVVYTQRAYTSCSKYSLELSVHVAGLPLEGEGRPPSFSNLSS